ncbi:MAG: cation-transporting P-type ATPase, partial [Armatimonadota bacterium]
MTTSTLNLRAEEQIQELLRELQTDAHRGLSDTVACDRLRLHGPNQLLVPSRVPPLLRLRAELRRTTTIVLLSAAAILAPMGVVTATALLVLVSILDCAIRFCRRYRAEQAAAVLSNLSAPVAQVIRSGRLVLVKSVHLVPGDVVRIRTGDCIPADGR